MRNSWLTPELEQLERSLARGPRPEPSAALRKRVFDDIRSELRDRVLDDSLAELRREEKRSKMQFGVAIAASLLVGVSLAFGAMHLTVFSLRQPESTMTVCEIANRIQCISPQLTHEDSLRQAMVRQIGVKTGCQTALTDIFCN